MTILKWGVTLVLLVLLTPRSALSAPGLPLEKVPLEEAELRLLLAERNLEKAYQRVGRTLVEGYRADSLRIGQRYRRIKEPLNASERRNRLAAEIRLENFAAMYTEPVYAADALLRLAALRMEDADEAYADAMQLHFQKVERGLPIGSEPKKDYAEALAVLARLLSAYPDSESRDLAWYLQGYCLTEMGNAKGAVAAFEALLRESPASPLRSEILLRIGDYFFELNQTPRALTYYAGAMEQEGPGLDRALYKWAWSQYKLNAYATAISAFTRLADMGAQRPDLQDEALQYLAISYVEGGGYQFALEHMKARGERNYDGVLLQRLADVLYESTDYASAVSAYTNLLVRNPLDRNAPKAAQRILMSLHQQRLVENAVERRFDFASQFGPGTPWYAAQATAPWVLAAADVWSEKILYEFSTFHHYRELRGHLASQASAEKGYRLYLSRFSGKPRAVQMGFYLAEILYDRDEYATALSYYTRVAYSAPDPATDIASRAAYNMVLSAREMFRRDPKQLELLMRVSRQFADLRPTDERTPLVLYHAGRLLCDHELHERCRDELSRLIELFPGNELALDAIRTVIRSFADQNQHGALAAWADRLLQRGQVVNADARRFVAEMVGGAMFQDALAKDQEGDSLEAAERYLQVYERYTATPAGIAALYNAAYSTERAKHYLRALELYDRLLQRHPTAKFAARASFRRGQIFENAVNYPAAISAYTLVFNRYPRSAEAKDSLFNVGALHALLGAYSTAALAFERHYATYGSSVSEPADTLLRAAAQWELAGDGQRARELFVAFTTLPHVNPRTPYAAYRAALLSSGAERTRLLKESVRLAGKVTEGTDAGTLAAARFELAEAQRGWYMGLTLPSKMKAMLPALNRKAQGLKNLQSAYTRVVEAGDPEFAVAALYRIGEAYASFADMLYDAPLPKELDETEAEIYRAQLEEQAAPVEEKAVQAFRRAEERAAKNKTETRWTALIRRSLHDKPSSIRILTDHLEPIYLAARRGLPEPAQLALRDEKLGGERRVVREENEMDVAASRLRHLLRGSVRRQRIFFHQDRPYLDRIELPAEGQP